MAFKKILLVICLLIPLSAMAAIYKWVDADGITHFSDQPHEGATVVDLPQPAGANPVDNSSANTNVTPPLKPAPTTPKKADTPKEKNYVITILSPENDQNVPWGDAVQLNVNLDVQPPLMIGDTVQVLVDGNVAKTGNATQYVLENLERGQHTLQAKIVTVVQTSKNSEDVQVKELASSDTITFYVQQPSVLNPNKNAKALSLTPTQIDRIKHIMNSQG